jgi:hypothetical protein
LGHPNITANVFQLGEVAEIEAQIFNFAQKLNRRTTVEFSTKPAILPKPLCVPGMVIRPFRHTLEINGKLGHIQVLLFTV